MSLRTRLLFLLGTAWLALGGAMTLWMFERATTQLDDVLDARLASSAAMVARLVAQLPQGSKSHVDGAALPVDVLARDGVACEVSQWRGEVLSRTVARVAGGPALRDASAGFGFLTQHGVTWRTYVMEADDLRIATADRMDMRASLSREIALTAVLPLAAGLLAGFVLLWLGIGHGLAPMERLRRSLSRGAPLTELDLRHRNIPKELQPFMQTISQLLRRMQGALERERRFSDNAAHEMRTPVTAVKTHLQVLARLPAPEGQALWRQSLAHALQGTAQLERLLEQLLAIARMENGVEGQAQTGLACDAVGVVEQVLEGMPAGRITLNMPGAPVYAALPDTLLASVVRNLLDNALTYSPADQPIDLVLAAEDNAMAIRVRDRGPGLSPSQCERAVEPFWRGARHGHGSGLGLSIVAAIVEHHGGTLSLRPAEGGGLACLLKVPLASGDESLWAQ